MKFPYFKELNNFFLKIFSDVNFFKLKKGIISILEEVQIAFTIYGALIRFFQ